MKLEKYKLEPRKLGPILEPPEDNAFFLWPYRDRWKIRQKPEHPDGIIRATLQTYGWTSTHYPFGFVIEIEKGAVIRGYSQAVSDYLSLGLPPHIAEIPHSREYTIYREDELDKLLLATPSFDTNEIWVDGTKARVVGAYASNTEKETGIQHSRLFAMIMKKIEFPLCLL